MYMYKCMKTDIEGYVFLSNPHALKFGTLSMSQTIDLYCTTFERVNSSHDTCCSFVGNSWLVSHTLTDLGPTHWNFLVFMNIYSSQYIDEKVKSKIMLWNHAVYNRWIRKHLRDLWNFLYEIWRSQTEYELFMKTREKSSLHTVSTCETDHGFPTMTSSLLYACY